MTSIAYRAIQHKTAQFLAEQISLAKYHAWIVERAWSVSDNPRSEAARLIHWLELRFAEYDAGHLPRKNFINELQELAVGALNAQPFSSAIPLDLPQGANVPFEPVGCSLYAEVCGTASGH